MKINEFLIINDKSLLLYQNNKKSVVYNFENNKVNCFLIINNQVICGTNDNFINIFNLKDFKMVNSIQLNSNLISIKEFTKKYFYGISSEYTLHFFNSINYEQLLCINAKTYNFYQFLIMNDSLIYSGSNNGLSEWNSNFPDLIDDIVDNIVLV